MLLDRWNRPKSVALILVGAFGILTVAALAASLTWGEASELALPSNAGSSASAKFQAQTASANSIDCSHPGSCVAVGFYRDSFGADQAMVLGGSSGKWEQGSEIVPPPDAAQNPSAELRGVACTDSRACVAVGSYVSGFERKPMLVTESDGVWNQAATITLPPDSAAESTAELNAVSCGVGSCVAVGSYVDRDGDTNAMELTETAGSWTPARQIAAPANAAVDPRGYTILTSVSCASTSCTTVGYFADELTSIRVMGADETNGTWHQSTELKSPEDAGSNPNAYLHSVSCAAPESCVAVGSYSDGASFHATVIEEDGGTWGRGTALAAPSNGSAEANPWLYAVTCPAAGHCLAVGGYNTSAGVPGAMTASQSDGTWDRPTQIAPPTASPSEAALLSVACPSSSSCVAVGQYTDNPSESDYAAMVVAAGPQTTDEAAVDSHTATPTRRVAAAIQRPKVSGLSLSNRRFRVARQATAITARSAPAGTRFRFTMSTAARLQIKIQHISALHRRDAHCVHRNARSKRARAKRCIRSHTVVWLTRAHEAQGPDSVAFSGRIGRRALAPGSYRATLTASGEGGRSQPVSVAFTVLR